MSISIVCWPNIERYYGENPELMDKYRQTQESGKCPFCDPHIENRFLCKTVNWNVVYNQYPYRDTILHLLMLPKRHVVSLTDLYAKEWGDLQVAIAKAVSIESYLSNGYGLALRQGEMGGVTLWHLHLHLIVPKVGENGGAIPVQFGIG